ncbi:PucR family transcriptional regulator [Agrococcus sp. ARC_14]|uniref:PucR family transcriptional regulator n=1 Tax=Agrococcus sp. ARC_14 TaxID=2919927 RepID=UPI001F05FD2C|nr:PucR family transcriptional regulator [Agrococcus sp. ARC_14]MCH1881924.1 PucR family transcriptional regulator [Agrococcus sp. ARC_14]
MRVTVADLVESVVGLTCVAGHSGLSAPVHWVHVFETNDPTPWLTGGEFLLTVDLGRRDDSDVAELCERLARRGVAGLGFGVGVTSDAVPAAWIRESERHGIPLLEVPFDVPFIGISRFVSDRDLQEQARRSEAMLRQQSEFAGFALSPMSAAGIVERLADQLEADAAVYLPAEDRFERLRVTAPLAGQPGEGAPFAPELLRAQVQRLLEGEQTAAIVAASGWYVHAARFAEPGAEGVGLIARRERFSALESMFIGSSMAIAELGARSRAATEERLAGLRSSALAQVWKTDSEGLRDALLRWLLGRSTDFVLAVLVEQPQSGGAARPTAPPHLPGMIAAAVSDDGVVALLPADALDLRWTPPARWSVGVSGVVDVRGFLTAKSEAVLASRAAARASAPRLDAAALLPAQRTAAIVDHDQANSLLTVIRGRLSEVDAAHSVELERALTAFLRRNGRIESAAADLGVHRQTLATRLRRAERILALDLDDPDDRATLWLALRGAAP